ncbi:hypothetical protein LWI29_000957 [Acer saccharum]|uniref:Uncharacterized protein n=1 Tax=Acer saccharum TaxID=4024 RepID=A0AA39RA73_ACESA|nr:hypothetical protein LWI29_000957 [Acer saccharum]
MMFEETFQATVDDPRSFVIPISVGGSELLKGMLDLGVSINMMPLALYEKLGLLTTGIDGGGGGGEAVTAGLLGAAMGACFWIGTRETLALAAHSNISPKVGHAGILAGREVGECDGNPARASGGVDASGWDLDATPALGRERTGELARKGSRNPNPEEEGDRIG